MTERESGWYKIKFNSCGEPEVAFYSNGEWLIVGSDIKLGDHDVIVICKMMTLSGELVYHKTEHDPVYNTKQEG